MAGGRWAFNDNTELHRFLGMMDTIKARRGFASVFDEGKLEPLVKRFGFPIMEFVIDACMENEWFRPGQWEELAIECLPPYDIEKVKWAVKRMQGRQNYSIDTVRMILRGEMPAYRKASMQLAADKPGGTKKAPKYPSPEGLHTYATAQSWMITEGKSDVAVTDYFELAGRDQEFGYALLRLKSEYR